MTPRVGGPFEYIEAPARERAALESAIDAGDAGGALSLVRSRFPSYSVDLIGGSSSPYMATPEHRRALQDWDIQYLLRQLPPMDDGMRRRLWSDLRGIALPEIADFRRVRWLHNGADVTADENGNEIKLPNESYADVIDVRGGAVSFKSSTEGRRLQLTLGGGADCMFSYLVSTCFADLAGFVEGQEFASLSGCTFTGYSTIAGCMTQVGTDMVADVGLNASVAICRGTYTENATWTTGSTTVGSLTVYGSGMGQTVMVGNFTIDGLNSSDDYVVMHDLTISGTLSTSGDASTGDRMRFRHLQCTDLAINANAGDCEFIGVIVDDAITMGTNVSALHFIDCAAATILNAGNITNFYWVGGEITGSITLQQWDTAYIETRFTGNGSAGYHFKGTGSGCRGLTLKGYFGALAATAAAKNYIEFDQGATVTIDTFIDVVCEKPTSTAFEVHYIKNSDTEAMRGVQVRLHCGMTSAGVLLEDMAGGYSSVIGEFIDSTFYLTPNRAKVEITAGSNNWIISGDGSDSTAGTASAPGWPRAQTPTALTISGGAVTVTAEQYVYTLDTEASAASDDLDTINGLVADRLYLFKPANDARTVVFKHETGNLHIAHANADLTADDIEDMVLVWYDGTTVMVMGGGGGGSSATLSDGAGIDVTASDTINWLPAMAWALAA